MTLSILAIDPGGTTGIAYATFEDDSLPELHTEMPQGFDEACRRFSALMALWPLSNHVDLLVVEKFTINTATAMKTTAGSNLAIELIGVAKYIACINGIRKVEEQKPVDAKNFADDKKLRRIGWYTPGPDHARDATRHLLLAAVRHKVINLAQLLPST